MLRKLIERLGMVKSILLIVLSSIVVSLLLYVILGYILNFSFTYDRFLIALLTSVIIVPLISWFLVGLIFKMMKIERELRNITTKDSLTNLLTKQSFLDNMYSIYQLAKRNKLNFTIFYIDIDNFKSINDTYGYPVGDKVLKSLAEILRKNKRESDVAGRIGGEAFAFALSDEDLGGAMFFAEKIRKLVENDMFENEGIYIDYTISIGISIYYNKNSVALEQLISQAETALFQSKKSGKNCVTIYAEDMK